jgi:hypothetical protein
MTSITTARLDGLSSSVAIKGPVRAATTANTTLSGEQTIDGVAIVTNDRVLVKDQTTPSENGIYVADTGPWRRSADFAKTRDVMKGTQVFVAGGTVGAGVSYFLSTDDPISVGTDTIAFTEIRDALNLIPYVTNRTVLKALDPTADKVAMIYAEGGRNGTFDAALLSGLSSAEQTYAAADTLEGVYIPSTQNPLYIWVRRGGWALAGFDPAWFGATYNSAAVNNAAAINAAIILGPVRLGAGYLYCTTGLSANDISTIIRGESCMHSEIRFSSAVATGFSATHTNAFANFSLSNLAWTTESDPANGAQHSKAINIDWPEGFGPARQLQKGSCDHVVFRGVDTENNGWYQTIDFTQVLAYEFNSCFFTGKDEGGAADQSQAKKTRSATCINLDGGWAPVEVHFTNCTWYHWTTGIAVGGSFEGLYLIECVMVAVRDGIAWTTGNYSAGFPGFPSGGSAAGRPVLTIKSTHMAVYRSALRLDGVVQMDIVGNYFYHKDYSAEDGVLILLQNGSDAYIAGNIFRDYAAGYVSSGIIVGSNFGYATIVNNNFATESTGIWFQAGGVGNNHESGNIFQGTYAVSSIFNQLNEDSVIHGHRTCLLYLTNNQSIPNNANTLISWDTKDHSTLGFSAGTTITVPAYSGIRRIRVTAGLTWDVNATGLRIAQIYKNGAALAVGATLDQRLALAANNVCHNLTTGTITVAENDTISLNVLQNSGGALNAQGSGGTWISIEVIE